MGCREVHRNAYFYIDGVLEQKRQNDLKSHIDDCQDCDQLLTIHRRLQCFIKARLRRVNASDGLKAKVAAILSRGSQSPA